jgi:hypothetical protein
MPAEYLLGTLLSFLLLVALVVGGDQDEVGSGFVPMSHQ